MSIFLSPAPPGGNNQQLVRGQGFVPAVQATGSFLANRRQPSIQLPSCFWVGTNAHTDHRRLSRTSSPFDNGTFYQLGCGGLGQLQPGSLVPGVNYVGASIPNCRRALWYLHPHWFAGCDGGLGPGGRIAMEEHHRPAELRPAGTVGSAASGGTGEGQSKTRN